MREVPVDDFAVGPCTGECATCDIDPGLMLVERGLEPKLFSSGGFELVAAPGDEALGTRELRGSRFSRKTCVARHDRGRQCVACSSRAVVRSVEASLRFTCGADRRGELGALATLVTFARLTDGC